MKKKITTLSLLVLTVVTVYFSFNVSTLDNNATQSIESLIQQLSLSTDYTIHLSGHSDNIGSDTYNDKLSEQRVIAVKNYLIAKNIDSTKIRLDSYGECSPAVPNTSNNNRALNRRVELTIITNKINTVPSQTISPEQHNKDIISPQKQENIVIPQVNKEIKWKKNKRHLVWTGWKTGFHWSTPKQKRPAHG